MLNLSRTCRINARSCCQSLRSNRFSGATSGIQASSAWMKDFMISRFSRRDIAALLRDFDFDFDFHFNFEVDFKDFEPEFEPCSFAFEVLEFNFEPVEFEHG